MLVDGNGQFERHSLAALDLLLLQNRRFKLSLKEQNVQFVSVCECSLYNELVCRTSLAYSDISSKNAFD